MKKFLLILSFLLPSLAFAAAPNFTYQQILTINHTKVTADQTDFPFNATTTDPNLKVIGSGGLVTSSSGFDVVYSPYTCSALNASSTPFYYYWENEKYVNTTGELISWVKIPFLSSTVDTTLYRCFGATSITTQQSTPTSVWDSNFIAVYHTPDGSSLNFNDSTINANNPGLVGASAIAGQIDGGASFNGSTNYVNVSTAASFNPTVITASGWINLNGTPTTNGNIMSKNFNTGWRWRVNNASNVQVLDRGGTNIVTGAVSVSSSKWVYVVFTGSASGVSIYVNGVADVTNGGLAWGHGSSAGDMLFGAEQVGGSEMYKGSMDELRISSTARSSTWVSTEYNNQSSMGTFVTQGAATNLTASIPHAIVRFLGGITLFMGGITRIF